MFTKISFAACILAACSYGERCLGTPAQECVNFDDCCSHMFCHNNHCTEKQPDLLVLEQQQTTCEGPTDVVITQISGQENFTMLPNGTFAYPNPIQRNEEVYFIIGGFWNVSRDIADIQRVHFKWDKNDGYAYNSKDISFGCYEAADSECRPNPGVGQWWSAAFHQSVFDWGVNENLDSLFDVLITATDRFDNELFQLGTKFCIPPLPEV